MFFSSLFTTFMFSAFTATNARPQLVDLFNDWRSQFDIKVRDEFHFSDMFQKWKINHKFISETNDMNLTYTLGHNEYSGMDTTEFATYFNLKDVYDTILYDSGYYDVYTRPHNYHFSNDVDAVPASIDWVSKGAVTPVKDQGQCGSCWSFSTTGALEGAYYNKNGHLVSFSEQQLVDCDNLKNGGRDHGCNGGLMDNAFTWITKNGGLCTEGDYPYVSGTTKTEGTCTKTCALVSGSKIAKYVDVLPSSDSAMMSALAQQPVAIAIQANQQAFQLYKSGVFTGTCGTNLDHGVLAVGYGTDSGADYYKVKNSWGPSWGESGYIRLGRGDSYNNGDGQCGMLLESSYPVL